MAAWLRGCVAANFARYAGACQVLRAIFVRFFAGKCTVFIGASLQHYYYSITRFSADFNVSRDLFYLSENGSVFKIRSARMRRTPIRGVRRECGAVSKVGYFFDSPMSVSESGAAGSSDRPLRKKIRCMTGCYIRAFTHSIKRMMFSTVSRRSLLARSFARL